MESITLSPNLAITLAVTVTLLAMCLCGAIGYLIASRYVAPRNNLSHILGGIFGLLATATVAACISDIKVGVIIFLITFIYTTFAVRLQRGG